MPWNLANMMRSVIRDDVIACFLPSVDNFVRVRNLGGLKNHLGEIDPYTKRIERFSFKAVETTGRGGLDDMTRTEREVGGQAQGEILLELLEDVLRLGDRVERLSDEEIAKLEALLLDPLAPAVNLQDTTTAFEVIQVEAPRLNNQVVSYQITIREQTD